MVKNMNQQIVNGYKRKGIIPNMIQHIKTFEETHGVKIIIENSIWKYIEFPDDQAYIIALLKWAN